MNDYIHYNLHSYLNKKSTNYRYLLGLVWVFIFLFFFLSIFISSYDIATQNATTLCENGECKLEFYWPIEKLWLCEKLKINSIEYEVNTIHFGEIIMDTANQAYQKIAINAIDYKGNNNEIVKLKIYKNKEKIIKKVWKQILERKL